MAPVRAGGVIFNAGARLGLVGYGTRGHWVQMSKVERPFCL